MTFNKARKRYIELVNKIKAAKYFKEIVEKIKNGFYGMDQMFFVWEEHKYSKAITLKEYTSYIVNPSKLQQIIQAFEQIKVGEISNEEFQKQIEEIYPLFVKNLENLEEEFKNIEYEISVAFDDYVDLRFNDNEMMKRTLKFGEMKSFIIDLCVNIDGNY